MMEKAQKEKSNTGETVASVTFEALTPIISSQGRRGVRIFGFPPKRFSMFLVAAVLLGIPFAVIVAMLPFWEYAGDFTPLKHLNSYVAPALENLASEYRNASLPRFPLKRFMIASMSMVELVFLINFAALFVRSVRKHSLLVWMCYDRQKLFLYTALSGIVFSALWFVFFSDWRVLAALNSRNQGIKLFFYMVISMPVAAFIFGHMTAIVGLGVWRDASRKLRQRNTPIVVRAQEHNPS